MLLNALAALLHTDAELKERGCDGGSSSSRLQPKAAQTCRASHPSSCSRRRERRGGHPPGLLTMLQAAGNRWLSAPLSRAGSPPGAGDLAARLNISASRAQLRHVAPLLPPTASARLLCSWGGWAELSLPLSHPASQAGSERRAAPWCAGDPARPPRAGTRRRVVPGMGQVMLSCLSDSAEAMRKKVNAFLMVEAGAVK